MCMRASACMCVCARATMGGRSVLCCMQSYPGTPAHSQAVTPPRLMMICVGMELECVCVQRAPSLPERLWDRTMRPKGMKFEGQEPLPLPMPQGSPTPGGIPSLHRAMLEVPALTTAPRHHPPPRCPRLGHTTLHCIQHCVPHLRAFRRRRPLPVGRRPPRANTRRSHLTPRSPSEGIPLNWLQAPPMQVCADSPSCPARLPPCPMITSSCHHAP